MNALEIVRLNLEMNQMHVAFFEDMRDAAMTQPTSSGGNHPLWVLGHLALVDASFRSMITGEANSLQHWSSLFGAGTTPSSDPSTYPAFDDVMAEYHRQRAQLIALLDDVDESFLEQPLKLPPDGMSEEMIQQFFPNVAKTLLLVANHHAFHCGQVADARRAAGRAPMFM